MPSKALARFHHMIEKASFLRKTQATPLLNCLQRQIYYHASLAMTVATWDSFVKEITKESIEKMRTSQNSSSYQVIYQALERYLSAETKKLNTPNIDNARNFIASLIGYDPLPHWTWPEKNLNHLQIKNRVEEIFRIRHSFAHGFNMPPVSWTLPSNGGSPRLTSEELIFNERLFKHLAARTDNNLSTYLLSNFGVSF